MARHAVPLLVAPALPCAERLEILIARARLLHQPVGFDPSEETLLTVLLSFDPTITDRRAARALAATFVAADSSFTQAPAASDLGSCIAETLQGVPASSACVVVALPDHSPDVAMQLRAALNTIRSCHEVGLIVALATAPADWGGCDFDGFVSVEPDQRGTDALRVFSMLAAMMAPGLMPCLDADDFRCALGTSANPSRIAEAVFLGGSSYLMVVSSIDQQVLQDTVGVAVMSSRFVRLSTQALIAKSVRARMQPNAALTLVSHSGLTVEPLGSSKNLGVLLLCKLRTP